MLPTAIEGKIGSGKFSVRAEKPARLAPGLRLDPLKLGGF
jgi:hypothetical protein